MHVGSAGIGFTDAELSALAERLNADRTDGREAFVYFNNDTDGHAVFDARRLLALVEPAEPRERRAA